MEKAIFNSGVRPPRFFWRGVLILLPVAILTVVALYSLRQDRLLAEQAAKELGAATAVRMAQAVGNETDQELFSYYNANFCLHSSWSADLGLVKLARPSDAEVFQNIPRNWQQANPGIDLSSLPFSDGRLNIRGENSSPQIYPLSPPPPEWLSELSHEQLHLWHEKEQAEFVSHEPEAARTALQDFIATKPSSGARANAEFEMLLLKTRGLRPAEAVAQFEQSRWVKSDQLSEAGLPVGQLMCYRALRLLPNGAGVPEQLLGDIAWAIQYRASVFSPRLIAEAERVAGPGAAEAKRRVAALRALWDTDERARVVLRDFQEQHPAGTWTNELFWVASSEGRYLLAMDGGTPVPSFSSPIYRLLIFPQFLVDKALDDAVAKMDISIPPYARVGVEIGGKEMDSTRHHFLMASNAPSWPVLGEAAGTLSGISINANGYPFRVRVYLADRDALYARQHQRTLLFGAMILASTFAALAGLASSYRGFHQQRRLSEMKSNFVSSVSHELRAPIASMRLLAESLERGKIADAAKQKQYFGLLVQEARRLATLTENILDFSRIERGSKKYEFEPANIAQLAEDTVQLMRPCAAERQVELDLVGSASQNFTRDARSAGCCADRTPQRGVPTSLDSAESFVCDALAVQQALVNLIDNAVKHSPPGGRVAVGVEGGSAGLSLWVEDHGPGIPAEEQGKIFERFYRRGSELRRDTQGVGIGLTIVQHIAEAHGGHVAVRSAPGQGSRFTLELPRK
jgi:signal transduction histidine kinase